MLYEVITGRLWNENAGVFLPSGVPRSNGQKWGIGIGSGVYGSLENGGLGYMPELTFRNNFV